MSRSGLRYLSLLRHNGKGRPLLNEVFVRKLSTAYSRPSPACQACAVSLDGAPSPLLHSRKGSAALSINSLRNASTTSAASSITATADASVVDEPIANTIAAPIEPLYPSSLDEFASADLRPFTEYIGFLKDLGLDYGWGPTAFAEYILEHVYIWSGTPWWASIILTTFVIRAALFRAYVKASDTAGRLKAVEPHTKPIRQRISAAQSAKDRQAMLVASSELSKLYKAADIKIWRSFVPMLQIPLGYGSFRLLEGMARLPVPGFEEGGALWFTNLAAPDPFYLLPLGTGFIIFWTIKKGGELGNSSQMNPRIQTFLQYFMPPLSIIFGSFWDSGTQLFFFTGAAVSFSQAWLLRLPAVRSLFAIQPLPTDLAPESGSGGNSTSAYAGTINRYQSPASTVEPKTSPPRAKGIMGGAFSDLKGAASSVVKSAKNSINPDSKTGARPKRSKGEMRLARSYEERRRREIAQEKFTQEQDKEERRRTRKEEQLRREREKL